MVTYQDIVDASLRIEPYVWNTSLSRNPVLSAKFGCNVLLKFENQQTSGSFKARGAYNKILSVPKDIRKHAFFVAASTGNHAAAFCTALTELGLRGEVYLPVNVAKSKLDFIKAMGVPFKLIGATSLETEIYCREVSEIHNYILVHPYNDPLIVAGQGTVAKEMLDLQPDLDAIIAPVGGGGLIAGISTYVKHVSPKVQIIGCQPANSPEMIESIKIGSIVTDDISLPTLSDGTAGGLERGSITFDICRNCVDTWAGITEDEIALEITELIDSDQIVIEGAAALPLAYLRKNRTKFEGNDVGIVITGKRISREKLSQLLC
ncbi:MAG: pyridoxal-phosphate dependent enzyme [Saprospiraceae bacterium]|nr:pyridoxal-phosphate dependent enzyme [Saprospiraceae bacterium]